MFECPLAAIQTWALSRIPSNFAFFPFPSIFTNLDYLYWQLPKDIDIYEYAWTMWYIWKARNDKIFNNSDQLPQRIVNLALDGANAWVQAQSSDQHITPVSEMTNSNQERNFGDGLLCLVNVRAEFRTIRFVKIR